MAYSVLITAPDGSEQSYPCGGVSDQEAMIYAGKVVETMTDTLDPSSRVTIIRDGEAIATASTVGEITQKPSETPTV